MLLTLVSLLTTARSMGLTGEIGLETPPILLLLLFPLLLCGMEEAEWALGGVLLVEAAAEEELKGVFPSSNMVLPLPYFAHY